MMQVFRGAPICNIHNCVRHSKDNFQDTTPKRSTRRSVEKLVQLVQPCVQSDLQDGLVLLLPVSSLLVQGQVAHVGGGGLELPLVLGGQGQLVGGHDGEDGRGRELARQLQPGELGARLGRKGRAEGVVGRLAHGQDALLGGNVERLLPFTVGFQSERRLRQFVNRFQTGP